MKNSFKTIAAVFAIFAVSIFGHALAKNATIEQAKNECLVGEQINGYLGVVKGATTTATIDREVRSVNQQRKAAYARVAEENGVTVDVIAQLTAETQINKAKSGHCVQQADGSWLKKP